MKSRAAGAISGGALTPLLDVLFLLLFALLALSDARESAARADEDVLVRLPAVEAGEGAGPEARVRVTIEVDRSGALRIGGSGETIGSRTALDTALAGALGDALPEEAVIEIAADRLAPHGAAVELLQHLRLRGFANVQLLAVGAAGAEGGGWLE